MFIYEMFAYMFRKNNNSVSIAFNIFMIILITYYSWLHFENKCNMSVNLTDLLQITTHILKENDINFWINWGIILH